MSNTWMWMCFWLRGSPAISPNIANCIVVILTYYCSHSTSRGWFIVGDVALILSHQSPSHCQCVVVGGCCCIGQHLRHDFVGAVITDHCPISPPGDSSGRTTSGGAVESECWSSGIQLWCQLKLYGGHHNIPCGKEFIIGTLCITIQRWTVTINKLLKLHWWYNNVSWEKNLIVILEYRTTEMCIVRHYITLISRPMLSFSTLAVQLDVIRK